MLLWKILFSRNLIDVAPVFSSPQKCYPERFSNKKRLHKGLLLVYFLVAMSFVQCTKPTIHDLHPVVLFTPESREFFGCRINGKSYSPKAADSASLGRCTYISTYAGNAGGVFNING